MAKRFIQSEEDKEMAKAKFAEALENTRFAKGVVKFEYDLNKVEERAELVFEEEAWYRMKLLVHEFSSEIAWHGIVERDPEDDNKFVVKEILVYPQEVTGATVTTDQAEYEGWMMSQPDEIFNSIRMQGHSHVRMGTSPSTIDQHLYDSIIQQLEGDMFYIFLIWNKENARTIMIYDMKKNVVYETADIDILVRTVDGGTWDFLKDAEKKLKKKTYTTPATTNYSGNYGGSYGGYGSGYYGRWADDYYGDYSGAGTSKGKVGTAGKK